jgi:arylsulfatase A-like enzyme
MGPQRLPNIILIVCDTLGAKHMSLYGYNRPTTPHLGRMVESDSFAVYARCFSPAPWTVPAHASLFTGLYPHEHGNDGVNLFLGEHFLTLPVVLASSGYNTIGISCNSLIARRFGYALGFEEFHEVWNLFREAEPEQDILRNLLDKKDSEKIFFLLKSVSRYSPLSLLKVGLNGAYKKIRPICKDATFSTIKALQLATRVLSASSPPFFLFINLMQTHDKYNPPSQYRNTFLSHDPGLERRHRRESEYLHYTGTPFEKNYLDYMEGLYDEEILFLDEIIYRIYQLLAEFKLIDNTVLIITSDHGELFGEHGHIHHLFTTYNELIHVPLIIRYPRLPHLRGFNHDLVQLHDLFSTIMDIVEAPYPASQSSISLLSKKKRDFAQAALLDVNFKMVACQERNSNFDVDAFPFNCSETAIINHDLYKLIRRSNGKEELYYLKEDFYETNNLLTSKETPKIKMQCRGIRYA